MSNDQVYTVSQLSKLAKISVRTLHYYDKIGLLKPIRRADNQHREYHKEHVASLQQILVYRELDFSISAIQEILTGNQYELLKAFSEQKEMLLDRITKAQLMINSIDTTVEIINGELKKEILFFDIPDKKIEQWDELRKQKGKTPVSETIAQALEQVSINEAKYYREQSENWFKEYTKQQNSPVESETVQNLVLKHYKIMNNFLYSTHEDFKGIGYKGYLSFASQILDDKITYELHENYGVGLAKHLNKAMIYFAHHTLQHKLNDLRKFDQDISR